MVILRPDEEEAKTRKYLGQSAAKKWPKPMEGVVYYNPLWTRYGPSYWWYDDEWERWVDEEWNVLMVEAPKLEDEDQDVDPLDVLAFTPRDVLAVLDALALTNFSPSPSSCPSLAMDSLLIPLRSSSSKDALTNTLPFIIPQINAQHGGFRHISEQSLTEDIVKLSSNGIAGDSEDEEHTDNYQERRKVVYEKKAEMLAQVGEAHNSALMALDFISLLLSKAGIKAEHTMSPFLKEHVPVGSMGVQVVERPTDDSKQQISLVSKGWKLESFDSAANSLLRSASRLEEEISQETKYWEQILAVKENGWSICRVPQERHALGVKYGFREASQAFRDRAIAVLRREDGGKVTLDRGLLAPEPRTIRIQIKTNAEVTGASIFQPITGESIEDQILEARNAIYDEELFFELNREARALISYGVEIRQNNIQFEYGDGKLVLISLEPHDASPTKPGPDSTLATHIILILRLLLSHIHRQNYESRSHPQSILNLQPRPNPPYSLIRPILAYIQHSSHLSRIITFLDTLFAPLKSAGLAYQIKKSPFSSTNLSVLKSTDLLIAALTSTLESTLTITLPSSTTATLTIIIKTNLLPQIQGTEYTIRTSATPLSGIHIPSTIPRITSDTEVEQMVTRIVDLDLLTAIASISRDHVLSLPATDDVSPKQIAKGSSGPLTAEKKPATTPSWIPTDPQNGELSRTYLPTSSEAGKTAKMKVVLSKSSLSLKWSWVKPVGDGAEYVWRGSDDVEMEMHEGKTLMEFVNKAAV